MSRVMSLPQMRSLYASLVAGLSHERKKAVEETVSLDAYELCLLQQVQASGHASGLIPFDDAMWLYSTLGGESPTVEKWNNVVLSDRIVIFQLLTQTAKRLQSR
jgi:hypothetical protein